MTQPIRNPLHSRLTWLLLAGLVLTFVVAWGGLQELVHRWYKQEEYSHAFFLPLISLWLLWQRRAALGLSVGAPSGWGLVALLLSAVMLVLGEVTALFLLMQLAFLLALVGLVLCYGGVSLLRVALLPIAFLLFAIPLPYFVDSQISWRLQLMSSHLGVDVLRALGYAVYLEGNVIDLGVYKLQVVEACSGLRYLYPLLSIGFLMAYMYPAALRWRALVFLSTIPITVLTNSLRIAMVGVLVERWGSGMADGFLHYFEGWVIFLVCLVVLMLEMGLIERFSRRRSLLDLLQFPPVAPVVPTQAALPGVGKYMPAAVVLLVFAVGAVYLAGGRQEVQPWRQSLKTFPLELGDWRAKESSLSIDVEQALGFSDYVLADYHDASGATVNLYVAYYASQRKGVSPHSPQVCIPGGGWVISSISRTQFVLTNGAPMEAVRVLIDKAGQRQLVYYWFEQRGRRIANEYVMKWYLLQDALLRNRSDGALVRVLTAVPPTEDVARADERLQRMVRLAVPVLQPYVPD